MSFARRRRALLDRISRPLDRLPIRARLALVSTALTFVIVCAFAVVVGTLTVHRIRSDFNRQVTAAATDLSSRLEVRVDAKGHFTAQPDINVYAGANHAVIRVLTESGDPFLTTPRAPNLGTPLAPTAEMNGYRVETRELPTTNGGFIYLQYARRISDVNATIARVRLLLILGIMAATALALFAGLMIARRAMAPIARLTATAGEIARTGDPSRSVPQPEADDEVAELARTFDEMLRALEAERAETEAMLVQQRRFVADASHELRTPLTSVLANLELLAETLDGDEGDAARSALRSSQRMRRLVADLLLLARTDVGRQAPREPVDLAQVVVEAAGELGPLSEGHEIALDPQQVTVAGARDDLLRMVINLMENAVRHTPPGTHVWVSTVAGPGQTARLEVRDDGPGVPSDIAPRLFERFVRGSGDRGASSGLGLSIVKAVAEAHGGQVAHEATAEGGTRFVVTLPALPASSAAAVAVAAGEPAGSAVGGRA